MAGRGAGRAGAPVHGSRGPRASGIVRGTHGSGRGARAADALGSGGRGVSITGVIAAFSAIVTAYFVLWNVSQIAMGSAGARFVWRYQRRRNVRSLALVARLA